MATPDRITVTLDQRTRRALDRLGEQHGLTNTGAVQSAVPLLDLALDQTDPTGENPGSYLAIVRPDGAVERIHLT